MTIIRSQQIFARSSKYVSNGTSRSMASMQRPTPVYIDRGDGAHVIDVDGNRYLDFNGNYTTLIHGHGHAPTVEAVRTQALKGFSFGSPVEAEADLAQLLVERVPGLDLLRFQNSGSEVVMTAMKAARAFTNRPMIAKVEGAYHGSYDYAEVSTGAQVAPRGNEAPKSVAYARGVPDSILADVIVIPQDDPERAIQILRPYQDRLAAVILDATPNMSGLVPLATDYVQAIRAFTTACGALLISDEVLNFRQSLQGAMARTGVIPDLFTFGKIIGGGLPIGAMGGRADVMGVFDHSHGRAAMPASGTFSANPMSMVAGLATMRAFDQSSVDRINALGARIRSGLTDLCAAADVPAQVTGIASLFRIQMAAHKVRGIHDTFLAPEDAARNKRFVQGLLDRGYWLPPTGTGVVSTVMDDRMIDGFLDAVQDVLAAERGGKAA